MQRTPSERIRQSMFREGSVRILCIGCVSPFVDSGMGPERLIVPDERAPERSGARIGPDPLPPGVCVEVFASTDSTPRTGSDWSRPNEGFYSITPRRTRSRSKVLRREHHVLLTSHTGCGCGFGFGLPGASVDEILESFERASRDEQDRADSSMSALIDWVRAHAPLELWIKTNTLRDDRPTRVVDTRADSLDEIARTLRVGDLVRIS